MLDKYSMKEGGKGICLVCYLECIWRALVQKSRVKIYVRHHYRASWPIPKWEGQTAMLNESVIFSAHDNYLK